MFQDSALAGYFGVSEPLEALGRPISFWEMLSLYAKRAITLHTKINDLRRVLQKRVELGAKPPLAADSLDKRLLGVMTEAQEFGEELGLVATTTCTRKFFTIWRVSVVEPMGDDVALRHLQELDGDLAVDLDSKYFLYVPYRLAVCYGGDFGSSIKEKFPEANREIEEAMNSLAVGRNTACAFHLMRAVEHLLRAFAVSVGVSQRDDIPFEYEAWQMLIQNSESQVAGAFAGWSKKARTDARGILRASIADFYSFKDHVRNLVMHTRSGLFDEPTAVSLYNKVRECFLRLEPYLSEDQDESILDESLWSQEGR